MVFGKLGFVMIYTEEVKFPICTDSSLPYIYNMKNE